jgi:hypothetical protein
MIDGSYSPHHTQEHLSSACWSAGTSEHAIAIGSTTLHTSERAIAFVIELVVLGSPATQGAPTEEQPQQQEDHNNANNEDNDDEEYSLLSDAEDEKMYRDANKVDSFEAEAPVPTGRLRAMIVLLGITTTPRYKIKEVLCPGRVEFEAIAEIFFRSSVLCGHQGPAFRASHSDTVADTAWQAITS